MGNPGLRLVRVTPKAFAVLIKELFLFLRDRRAKGTVEAYLE